MSRKYEKAFTTLELLIILVIIGFFVAMLAPRLSQMFDDATMKVSDMNKKDSMRFSRMWTVKHGPQQIGNNLMNIVNYTGADDSDGEVGTEGNYQYPSLAEYRTPEDGAEQLSYQFMNRLKPYMHTLTQDEVDELADMGLTHIYMLDTQSANNLAQKRFRIRTGMRVLMVGAGRFGGDFQCQSIANWSETNYTENIVETQGVQADPAGRSAIDDGGIPHSDSADDADGIGYETGIGYPQYFYRIIMGIGEDSTLVTDGVVDNEGISPDALSQEQHYRFNRYVVLLPRLRSTVRNITGRGDNNSTGATTTGGHDSSCPSMFVGERDDANGRTERKQWIVADLVDNTAQPFDEFDVLSPEGYKVLDRTLENLADSAEYAGPELWQTVAGASGSIYDPSDGRMFQR